MSHVQACEFSLANQHPSDAESARVTALTFARIADRETQRKATIKEAIYTLRQAPYGSLTDGEVAALIEILQEQLGSVDTGRAFRIFGEDGLRRTLCKEVAELLEDSADLFLPDVDPDDAIAIEPGVRQLTGMEANYAMARMGGVAA